MYRLNLHKQRHGDVRNLVIRFIEKHWQEETELEIITGNSNKMKEIVREVINEYGLDMMEGRPFDFNNKGYIIIWT